ncbi:hypothetical protein [Mycobacterium sp. DL592]|uniref:hypothetical protein n=1 Tax=Mycobacterium sp. DL592 TaxID=2675524 RepID=UPI00141F5426|nr:hypothetical protein [Mycobacterium sp. DL592]
MAFQAYTYGTTPPREYGDEDEYEFLDGGVLVIREIGKGAVFYAPHKWDQIVAEPGHLPGRTGGAADVLGTIY